MYYHIPKHSSFDDLLLSLLPQMATWLPSTAALYSCETLLWTRDSTISSAGAELFPLASVKDLRNIISAMLSILFQTATQSFNKLCCERKANKEVQQKSQWNKRKRANWSCAQNRLLQRSRSFWSKHVAFKICTPVLLPYLASWKLITTPALWIW